MHLQENILYDLDLEVEVKVTQNVCQYPPNHMTFAPAKFEVATPISLGEDALTRKYIPRSRSHKMLPSTLHIM